MESLNGMSLRQKIGQMLVTGFPGTETDLAFEALVREYKVGNIILFRRNQRDMAQLETLCQSLAAFMEAETGLPPFITSDEEGGVVSRLPADMAKMPSAMAQAALGDAARVEEAARLTARELLGVGINFNLAPVLDVNSNPENPVIGVRSYGATAEAAAQYALAAFEGYRQEGILTTGKHFPGHGDTNTDSHLALPVVEKSLEELEGLELVPFRAAIKAGIPAITIAHVLFPALEARRVPATMSHTIITGLLRQAMGFEGLVISDCMEMDAIKRFYGVDKGTVEAVKAGMDLVFISHTPTEVEGAVHALEQAVDSGELPMARIDDAVGRIMEYKRRYIHPGQKVSSGEMAGLRSFATKFTSDAIAASCPVGQGSFALGGAPLFVSPLRSHVTLVSNVVNGDYSFAGAMQQRFGGEAFVMGMEPDEEEQAHILKLAAGCSSLVLGTVNGNAYPAQLRLAGALAKTGIPLACVALRNPFEIELLPEGVFRLALYEYAPETVELAMDYFKKD
ncbi:glycoside hydrolase family 3 protein [Ruminococcaceae bacterium OttesenSCG-928-D13]|nr:glycoside hydrolase family 3 protein [Ruminococcaceae bacterium OttesenSCG-928-D13]